MSSSYRFPRWRKHPSNAPDPPPGTDPRRRWPLVVGVALALVLFGLVGGWQRAMQPEAARKVNAAAQPAPTATEPATTATRAAPAPTRPVDLTTSMTTVTQALIAETSASLALIDATTTLPIKLANAFKRKLNPDSHSTTTAAITLVERGPAAAAAATPVAGSTRYRPSLTLNEYLEQQLGNKYHPRTEWAGHRNSFLPVRDDTRSWEPIGKVEYITIHHASGVPNEHPARMIRNIFIGHTDVNGRLDASDVGYHFFVDSDGEVWAGRDARRMGTHVGSKPHGLNNEGNLGICGLGSYAHEYPPNRMVEGIVNLSLLICKYYGRPLTIRGHKEWQGIHGYNPLGGTDCPGRLARAVTRARSREDDIWPRAVQKSTKSKSTKRVAQRDDSGKARAVRKPAPPARGKP